MLDALEAAMTGVSVILFFLGYLLLNLIIFVVDFIIKKR
jgi:hypothetical protein